MKVYIIAALIVVAIILFIMVSKNKPATLASIDKDAFLVDVRTSIEFSGGSVPNAVNIPLSTVESNLDAFKNKESIVVFCRSGNRSGKAKVILESHGITQVQNGGSWKQVLEALGKQ